MSVGIPGTNPTLVIDVKYDNKKSESTFIRLKANIEKTAEKHEARLKQINERGEAQRRALQNKFNDKLLQDEQVHQEKLRRMSEIADKKLEIQKKAAQQRMLASNNAWSAKMVGGINRIGNAMKTMIAVYVGMILKNAISGAFDYADDLSKTSEALNIAIEDLQVYNHMLNLAGSNAERTAAIFEKLSIKLSNAAAGNDVKSANIFNKLGIGTDDNPGTALEKIIQGVKKESVKLDELSAIFGDKLAAKVFKIATSVTRDFNDVGQAFNAAKEKLGKNLLSESEVQKIEQFNDAISTLSTSIKTGFARAMVDASGEGTAAFNRINKSITEINWEKVGDGILVIIKALEGLGNNFESASRGVAAFVRAFDKLKDIVPTYTKLAARVGSLWDNVGKGDPILANMAKQFKAIQLENMSFIQKIFEYFSSVMGKIYNFWKAFEAGESVFGKVGSVISKTLEGITKALGPILKPLGTIFKLLGKWSGILTALFAVFDFIDGLTSGLNVLKAALYSVFKLITDTIDGLAWILSLGNMKSGVTDWMRNWGIWGDAFKNKTEGIVDDLKMITTYGNKPIPITTYDPKYKPKPVNTYNYPNNKDSVNPFPTSNNNGDNNNGDKKSWLDDIKDQIESQEKLRAETLKHIKVWEQYKNKYKDNADVLKIINEKLAEQREIIKDLDTYKNKDILLDVNISPKGFNLPENSYDVKKVVKQQEVKTTPENSIFKEIINAGKELQQLKDKLVVLENMKGLFADGSNEAKALKEAIEGIQSQLDKTGFEKLVNDWNDWYSEWNQVVARTAEFFQGYFDGITEGYNNQLEVLDEIIRRENERWDNANSRMEESGIKNTAYYVAQKKAHEKYVKQLEDKEYDLKGKAWDADKQSKIASTIMNTAQAIMGAWAAGPVIGAIMSAIIAANGAIQLSTISSQKNPYRKSNGGWIPGTGYTDGVSTLLTPGEFVVNRNAAKENAAMLEQVNNGSYREGGTTNVYVTIDGTIIGEDSWVEQKLIPGINKAISKGYELRNN